MSIIIVISAMYGCSIHLNYLMFRSYIEKNDISRLKLWLFLMLGPILTLKIFIKRYKNYKERVEILKMLKSELPKELKKYNIKVEGGNKVLTLLLKEMCDFNYKMFFRIMFKI